MIIVRIDGGSGEVVAELANCFNDVSSVGFDIAGNSTTFYKKIVQLYKVISLLVLYLKSIQQLVVVLLLVELIQTQVTHT